jgi:hypothetical protein
MSNQPNQPEEVVPDPPASTDGPQSPVDDSELEEETHPDGNDDSGS